ncbi:MAG: type II toxin-antitoxin system VapC family toxin [Planctomycetes bacterium]|nr:type II toxin-antitoxin system VapC family toxin [Planctomycetota bacterium]
MIIPDINLLVYAYNLDAPRHRQAKQWWEEAVGGHQSIGIAWIVALGFVRILTSRTVMARPMEAKTALGHVRLWLEQPSVRVIQPGPRHLDILDGFVAAGAIASAVITDAHLAALAIESQATVHSNDTDFGRFPGLRWIDPLAT